MEEYFSNNACFLPVETNGFFYNGWNFVRFSNFNLPEVGGVWGLGGCGGSTNNIDEQGTLEKREV